MRRGENEEGVGERREGERVRGWWRGEGGDGGEEREGRGWRRGEEVEEWSER